MKLKLLLLCFLFCGNLLITNCEILHLRLKDGNIGTLTCGKINEGKVTWSRDISGQKVDILTTNNGNVTKHITDPERRYSSGGKPWLIINRVSQSDAGRYYCNETTVELTVIPKPGTGTGPVHMALNEGNIGVLTCGTITKGKVTWSRDISGQKVDILTTNNGKIVQGRYSSGSKPWLIINKVSQTDAGRYYCNDTTVELTVIPKPVSAGGVSVVELVLKFGGVGLAALVFVLAAVAAGRALYYQAWLTGWRAGSDTVQITRPQVSDYENEP